MLFPRGHILACLQLTSLWAVFAQGIPESCYPLVGCFSNKEPWISASRPVLPPQNPKDVSTSMIFFNKQAADGITFPVYPEIDVSKLPFDLSKPTVAVYHCYLGNATAPWLMKIKDAYVKRADANVVLVEWRMPEKKHAQAVSDARVLGKLAALAMTSAGVDPSNLYLAGFCVGANAASYTAKYLAESGKKPARLIAMSPIWQFFDDAPPEVRMTPNDADFVMAVHTDMAGAGTSQQPNAHVDFYINGGFHQHWCPPSDRMAVKTCSHSFAHEIYAEAVEDNCIVGEPAELVRNSNGDLLEVRATSAGCRNSDCMPLGLNIPASARGTYAITTNSQPAYCQPVA